MVWLLLVACRPPDQQDAPIEPYDPLVWVDPFVGTGGVGFEVGSVNPGPRAPFGMVHLGPDTRTASGAAEYLHCAGYHHDDDRIAAFSHAHAHGMGVADYGVFGVLPRTGWDDRWTRDGSRAAPFDHASEVASPGYYAVTLADDGVRVELTATEHVGVHRYTYPAGVTPTVVFDLGHVIGGNDVRDGSARWDGDTLWLSTHVDGSYSRRFGGLRGDLAVRFDPAPVSTGAWSDPDAPVAGATEASGPASGFWVTFAPDVTVVTVRAGLSWVDAEGARRNLEHEAPDGVGFDVLHDRSRDAWTAEMQNVRVRGGDDVERTLFHTALFHAYQMPARFSDVDGRYRGVDGAVHLADFPYYTDFSLWDTYRTLHPWLILARPERQEDMLRSLVQMQRDVGSFDRWPLAHGVTGGMIGSPTDQVLAESWLKGLRDFPVEEAWAASLAHASGPVEPVGRGAIEGYIARGYVAWEDTDGPASHTLEYAWSDAALCAWAEGMGVDAEGPCARQHNWRNTWDEERGFFVGRYADGTFSETFDPIGWSGDFVEGGGWHYVWMAPYDVDGLIDRQHAGDRGAFLDRLAQFWALTEISEDDAFPDDYYWHGNEPDLHAAWLGSLAGDPAATVGPVRWVRANRYRAAPAGLDGNDDGGTLSAWYLWSALGVYPVAGTTRYAVGPPLFERVEIDRPGEGTRVVAVDPQVFATDTLGWALGDEPQDGGTFEEEDWVGQTLRFSP